MSDVFLHLPERLAGYPVSLEEAVGSLMAYAYGADFRLHMQVEEVVKLADNMWQGLCLYLATGSVHSFAQANDTGSWFRIPAAYWGDWHLLNGKQNMAPPSVLKEIKALDWVPANLMGAPVVVWREDLSALPPRWPSIAASHAESSQTAESVAKPGRPRGSVNYPGDDRVIDQVIMLCDSGQFTGPARTRHAIMSLIDTIEPRHLDAEAKVKRVRGKVIERRPDLRS